MENAMMDIIKDMRIINSRFDGPAFCLEEIVWEGLVIDVILVMIVVGRCYADSIISAYPISGAPVQICTED
jgi:hypothetical protein